MQKTLITLAAVILLSAGTTAQAGLINPGFETGDFTGWTLFNTPNGVSNPNVVLFDTDNDAADSYAARFQVGNTSNYTGLQEGGGIYQSLSLPEGLVSIDADVASYASGPTNMSGGVFSLWLDDMQLDTYDFDYIVSGTREFATLSGSANVAAGDHTVKFLMTRPYTTGSGEGYTPYQYIDDVALTTENSDAQPSNVVPEPATMLLFGSSFLGLAGLRKKK